MPFKMVFLFRSARLLLSGPWKRVNSNAGIAKNVFSKTTVRDSSNGSELSDDTVRKTRLIKRIGAGLLFTSVLSLAIYSKKSRAKKLRDSLEDCERLPPDPDYMSKAGTDLYKCKSCIFPGDIVKSGTLKQLQSLELKRDDIIVASFPKSGTYLSLVFSKKSLIVNCFI